MEPCLPGLALLAVLAFTLLSCPSPGIAVRLLHVENLADWHSRIEGCGATTPWKSMSQIAGRLGIDLGKRIADQVQLRLSTQGKVIDQGAESLCGVVSLENILVLSQPDLFANVIADLFCDGSTALLKHPVTVSQRTLNCQTSSNTKNKTLFSMETEGKIHEVDFIFAGTLGAWGNGYLPMCGSQMGQAQSVNHETNLATQVFPAKITTYGGDLKHVLNFFTTGFLHGLHTTHLKDNEWEKVLSVVRGGGQALLAMNVDTARNTGGVNHIVVLTRVLNGDGVKDACSSKLLQKTSACVIWTWASYYIFENCHNLRKMTGDAVLIELPPNRQTLGPQEFLAGSDGLEGTTAWIRFLHGLRHSDELAETNSKYSELTNEKWKFRAFALDSQRSTFLVPSIAVGYKQKNKGYKGSTYEFQSECQELYTSKAMGWDQVLGIVRGGGQALIAMDVDSKDLSSSLHHLASMMRVVDEKGINDACTGDLYVLQQTPACTIWRHRVVLTQVVDGSGVLDDCTRKLLEETPACVIWHPAWNSYVFFESCENLRELAGGVGAHLPKNFVWGSSEPETSVILERVQILHGHRHTGALAPASSLSPAGRTPEYSAFTKESWKDRFFDVGEISFVPTVPMGKDKSKDYKEAIFRKHNECADVYSRYENARQ